MVESRIRLRKKDTNFICIFEWNVQKLTLNIYLVTSTITWIHQNQLNSEIIYKNFAPLNLYSFLNSFSP